MKETPGLRERLARALTAYRMFLVSRGRISLEEWCDAARDDPTDIHDYHAAAILLRKCGLAEASPFGTGEEQEAADAGALAAAEEAADMTLVPLNDALSLVRQMSAVHAAAMSDALRNMAVKDGGTAGSAG